MIRFIDNFLNNEQITHVLSLWDDKVFYKVNDEIYRFKGIDLLPIIDKLNVPEILKSRKSYNSLRIQLVDESINQVEYYHAHTEPYSFSIFLNEEFNGGELVFLDKEPIKPKKGTMVYFTGDERHRVESTFGNRFTLIGFLREDLFNKESKGLI
jgi:hypothetical protein